MKQKCLFFLLVLMVFVCNGMFFLARTAGADIQILTGSSGIGSFDTKFTLFFPNNSVSRTPYGLAAYDIRPEPSWLIPSVGAWIGPENGNQYPDSPPAGTYTYIYEFFLDDPSGVRMEGQWATDNTVVARLNGQQITDRRDTGAFQLTYFSVLDPSFFRTGVNELRFEVNNEGSTIYPDRSPTGLYVNATLFEGPTGSIEYKETLTRLVHEDDVREWAPESRLTFGEITCSADGSKVAFVVDSSFPNIGQHLYVMNGDGTALTDITASVPTEVETLGTLQLNDDGSRLFFEGSPGDTKYMDIYYYDTVNRTSSAAVLGLDTTNNVKRYDINGAGTRIFFRHNAGWDDVAEKYHQGLYYADVGGSPIQVLDWDELPCDVENCGRWYNNLYFLGIATHGNRLFFKWDTAGDSGSTDAMWRVDLDGSYTKVPDEAHDYLFDIGWNIPRFVSADGGIALYVSKNRGEQEEVSAVDLATGAKTLLGSGGNLDYVTLSPAGTYAHFSGISYNRNQTRVHLRTGEMRDTLSEHIRTSGVFNLSHITSDDRYYFKAAKPEIGIAKWDYNRIHRVDMAPTNFGVTPNITDIRFSAPALYHDGDTTITVNATVSDAQGLDTIEWVKMHYLVEGLEAPDWRSENSDWSNSGPLRHSSSLYDDGTHGDQIAGDGIYTDNSVKTQSTSGFFDKYTLPRELGIRIVAKDSGDNYCIADTVLTITDVPVTDGPEVPTDGEIQCATFDLSNFILHVPCLYVGATYWLDLEFVKTDPLELELVDFGAGTTEGQCASFDLFTNTLHIPCVDLGISYWLDLSLESGGSGEVILRLTGFGEV